jgi:hypothetical protein
MSIHLQVVYVQIFFFHSDQLTFFILILFVSNCWIDLNPDRSNRVRVSFHSSAAALIGGVLLIRG